MKWEHIASNIEHFRTLLGSHVDRLCFEDRQTVVQLLGEKVVVSRDGAVEVHHVLPFEEQPIAADQKKKASRLNFMSCDYNISTCQRHRYSAMIVWAESTVGASVVNTNTQPGQQEARRARRAFFMPLPAFVPGTIGVLDVQAIGMHPAPYLMLAACRAACHRQGAQRFHALAFQGGAQLQWRSRRVPQDSH